MAPCWHPPYPAARPPLSREAPVQSRLLPRPASSRVYITAELKDALRSLYHQRFKRVVAIDPEEQAEIESEHGDRLDQWIFTDTAGNLIDDHSLRHRISGPLLKAVGLRKVRIHDLRHGYASLLMAAGKPLKFIQEQLGHQSASFTLATYGHLLRGEHEGLVGLGPAAPPPLAPRAPTAAETRDSSEGVIEYDVVCNCGQG